MPHTPVSPSPRRAQAWPALPALIGGVLVAALAIGAALGPYAQAVAPCHVPGDYVTLQAAVDDPDCAIINVAAGTYTGNFPIDRDVTIRGDGQDRTFIEGVGLGSVVQIDSGAAVTIKGVTIQGGASTFGGGIFNGGRLTLENSTVTANAATLGGGLFNAEGSTFTLKNSTVTANTVDGNGGGIFNAEGSTLTIENSTFTENTAGLAGGGIFNGGRLTLKNSTLAENTAGIAGGGGLYNEGTVTLTRVTFQNNTPNDCTGCP